MKPQSHLWAQLVTSRGHGTDGRLHCAHAARSWLPGGGTARDTTVLEEGAVGVHFRCARSAGWIMQVQVELRHLLAAPALAGCLRLRIWADAASGDGMAATVPTERGTLGCGDSYHPVSHALLGHHRLLTLPAEGITSVYVACMHQVVHQAFAWQWGRAHAQLYSGSGGCGCGQRVTVLHPPIDESGRVLEPMLAMLYAPPNSPERASLIGALRAQLPGLLLDNALPLIELWTRWATMPDAAMRWLRRRALSEATPIAVVSMADRQGDTRAETLLVLPQRPVPLSHEVLSALRDTAGEADGLRDGTPMIFPCGWAGAEEAWIPNVLLSACTPRVECLSELIKEAAAGRHARPARAFVPGAVLVLQSQQMPVAAALAHLYGTPLGVMILVHISDGNIWQHRIAATARMYAGWRHSLRQYWLPDASGALEGARRRGEVEWFPIGMNPQWVTVMAAIRDGTIRVPPASSRRHVIAFLGSTDKSARAARIAIVDDALRALGLHVHHTKGNVACYGSGCDDDDYIHATLDSALCLHLPGSSVESNRMCAVQNACPPPCRPRTDRYWPLVDT